MTNLAELRSGLSRLAPCLLAAALAAGCGNAPPRDRAQFIGPPATGSYLQICPAGATVRGVDVSTYQGAVDWASASASGLDFAIARVSDGSGTHDGRFAANWSGIKAAGLIRGVYQFFEPADDPVAQADLLLAAAQGLGAGDIPPVVDVEVMGGQSVATVVSRVAAWVSHVKAATGLTPLVYTSPSFWNGLGNPDVGAALWIANWGVACPSVPAPYGGWQFWQGSDTGSVSGISGAVDTDEFNGTRADLDAYVGAGNPMPPALTVALTAPGSGATLAGSVEVTATASAQVTRLELYVDGALLAAGTASPFTAAWDTTGAADGAHSLSAIAYAGSESATSAAVPVTVSNGSAGGGGGTCPPGTTDVGGVCTPTPSPSPGCSGAGPGGASWLCCAFLAAFALRPRARRRLLGRQAFTATSSPAR